MNPLLLYLCRVVRRSKLSQIHVIESLPKPLKVSENIENKQLFILSFRKNKSESSGLIWENQRFGKSTKTAKISEEFDSRKLFILHFQKNESNLLMDM